MRSSLRLAMTTLGIVLLGTSGFLGCSSRDLDGSSAAHVLRENFPEQAHLVLQQDDSFRETALGFSLKDPGARGTWRSIEAEWPRMAQEQIRFRLPTGLEVRVREMGAEGPGRIAEHALVYPRQSGKSYWASAPGGYEEWLHLDADAVKRSAPVAVWHIEGATAQQAEDAVEIVDSAGIPRIRVNAPAAYAAGGKSITARITGQGERIELFVDAEGEDVLVDPIWIAIANMATARVVHGAVVLADGRVLVAGGYVDNYGLITSSVEIFDPSVGTWSAATSMNTPRSHFMMMRLPTNKILVAGGLSNGVDLKTAEIYDPATNLWSPAASMSLERYDASMTLLGNGKVLVAGGGTNKLAEIYDPATNKWSAAASMTNYRYAPTAVLLPDGRVLVAGGISSYGSTNTAEIYDPATNQWLMTGSMAQDRYGQTMTLLDNGKVLVAGGKHVPHAIQNSSAEVYDPATGNWSSAGSMSTVRFEHTATLLTNGRVLVAGGRDEAANISGLGTAEQYDPATNAWSAAGSLATGRFGHTASLLQNGKVLIAGGEKGNTLASTEIYLLSDGLGCATHDDCQSGFCVDGVCCNDACGGGTASDCQVCNATNSRGICTPIVAGSTCRAATDICDIAEVCDGSNTACPADAFMSSSTICRTKSGTCDIAERCTGTSAACPSDSVKTAGTVCREAAGDCDVDEMCNGTAKTCPSNAFVVAGTVCRPAAGICDIQETCSGTSANCPTNAFHPAGTQCLNAPGICSPAQACTGTSAICP